MMNKRIPMNMWILRERMMTARVMNLIVDIINNIKVMQYRLNYSQKRHWKRIRNIINQKTRLTLLKHTSHQCLDSVRRIRVHHSNLPSRSPSTWMMTIYMIWLKIMNAMNQVTCQTQGTHNLCMVTRRIQLKSLLYSNQASKVSYWCNQIIASIQMARKRTVKVKTRDKHRSMRTKQYGLVVLYKLYVLCQLMIWEGQLIRKCHCRSSYVLSSKNQAPFK